MLRVAYIVAVMAIFVAYYMGKLSFEHAVIDLLFFLVLAVLCAKADDDRQELRTEEEGER